jgi:hypothetical protein
MEKICSLPLCFSQDQRATGLPGRESLNAGDWQVKMGE